MRFPTLEEVIIFVTLALLAFSGWYFYGRNDECNARGGTMIRTAVGYECVALAKR